jgi:hypothetical protein
MRLNWIIPHGQMVCNEDIQNACKQFYHNYKIVPDTVKMSQDDFAKYLSSLYNQSVKILERGKDYGLFLLIPGGMVELLLLDDEGEATANSGLNGMNSTIMVVESSQVDREFEKHVLNKED